MAFSKRVRFEVFKRDEFTCQYCGRNPPAVVLECDHVIAVASGGGDEITNLITACFDCNRGKSDVSLSVAPKRTQELIELEKERAAQVTKYNDMLAKLRIKERNQVDRLGVMFHDWFVPTEKKGRYTFDDGQSASVKQFLRQLPPIEVEDAIEIACSRKAQLSAAWKYFCGICWNKIKDRNGGA